MKTCQCVEGVLLIAILLMAHPVMGEGSKLVVRSSDMGTYLIDHGDTLSGLAQTFNVTVEELVRLNPGITSANYIKAGYGLKVPLHRFLARTDISFGSPGGGYESLVLELPSRLLELPPDLVARIVKESMPLIMQDLSKDVRLDEADVSRIESVMRSSFANLVAAFPKEMDLSGKSKTEISTMISEAIKEMTLAWPGETRIDKASMREFDEKLSQTANKVISSLPKEMELGEKSLAAIDERLQNTLSGQLPQRVDIAPQAVAEIRYAVKGLIPQIARETGFAVRQEMGASLTEKYPWGTKIVLLFVSLFLLVLLILCLIWFLGKKENKKDLVRKAEENVLETHSEKEKQKNNLSLAKNAGVKEFNEWLRGNKQDDPDKRLHCFRCGETIMAKNMKRHIYERCIDKPYWAKDNELHLEKNKKYLLNP